ncbi:MAG: peptidoglycan DD-metalloendopeptidase family protein [Myxococcales bacterium]
MASPPGAGGSRYAGRVVDPDVRDDGETEPEVELNPSPPLAPALTSSDQLLESAPGGDEPHDTPSRPGTTGRGAEIRERLLAKARAAEQAKAEEPTTLDDELEAIGRDPAATVEVAEDFAPGPPSGRAPSAPFTPSAPRELSPTLVAIFSALVGIATIASITALFMSLETRAGSGTSSVAAVEGTASVAPPSAPEPKQKAKRARQKIPGPWRLSDAKGDAKYRFIEGKVGTDSFLKALEAAGAPEAQGYRVLAAMRGVLDLDKCKKSDRFQALLERGSNKLFALEYLAGPEDVYQAKETDGRLTGSKLDLKIERGQVLGALSYDGSSFDRSADLAGFDPGLSKVVQRALDGQMSLDELERGDVIKVVVQEVTVLGEFARYAGVEALELVRADPKKPRERIYYWDAPNVRGYYDHDGKAPFEGGWRKPIKDAPRTSPWNPKRVNPVLHKVMPHQGTDFGSPVGTPIGASSFGTVSFIGPAGAAGNLVKVMHPGGIETGYAHMSRFAEGLKVGDKVKRMQLLGYVGSTGRSTGPHLHFSASRDGTFFDPETLNLDGMRTLTPEEREAFRPIMAKYDAMLDGIPMPERFQPLVVAKAEPTVAAAAAPVPAVAVAPGDDSGEGDDDAAAATAPAAPAVAAAPPDAAPAAAAPPGAAPAAAAQKPGGSAVYLSDKELLDAQSATDDGEVEE